VLLADEATIQMTVRDGLGYNNKAMAKQDEAIYLKRS
jgi:hypothetical protein